MVHPRRTQVAPLVQEQLQWGLLAEILLTTTSVVMPLLRVMPVFQQSVVLLALRALPILLLQDTDLVVAVTILLYHGKFFVYALQQLEETYCSRFLALKHPRLLRGTLHPWLEPVTTTLLLA